MRNLKFLAILAIVVIGAVGCADPGNGPDDGAPAGKAGASRPAGIPTEPGSAVAPKIEPERQPGEARVVEGTPLPAERIDGTELPANFPRKVHVLDDGASLAIVARVTGCGRVVPEVTEQTSAHVTVVLVPSAPRAQPSCGKETRLPTVTVGLAEPLGQRDVVLLLRER